MLRVEFEPMVSASERAKAVHALERSATVTGIRVEWRKNNDLLPGI
jgi:hypothetical protein